MLTSFHPNAYFFWGKCFLLSEKTKAQSAKKPGFSAKKNLLLGSVSSALTRKQKGLVSETCNSVSF